MFKALAAIGLLYCLLLSLENDISITFVMIFLAASFSGVLLANRMPFAAAAATIGAITPFLILPMLDRQVDGMYYEKFLNLGYQSMFNIIIESNLDFINEGSNRARGAFLLFVYPLIPRNSQYSAFSYIPFNFFMVASSSLVLKGLVDDFCRNHGLEQVSQRIAEFSVAAFLLSPSVLFFSNDLLKDQTSMFLVLLTSLLFIRGRFVLCGIALLLAILIRSYNPLIIFSFVLAMRRPTKWDLRIVIFASIFIMAIVRFNVVALANIIFAIPYVYVNPIPFRLENWEFPTGMITFQGLFFIIPFIISVIQIFSPNMRERGWDRIALGIAVFAGVVIAVGFNNITNILGESYSFGQGGDNMTRKCFPILPLLCVQAALAYRYVLPKKRAF